MIVPYLYTEWALRYAEDILRRFPTLRQRLTDLEQEILAASLHSPVLDETGITAKGRTSNPTMATALKLGSNREFIQLSLAITAVNATLAELSAPERAAITGFYWHGQGTAPKTVQRRKVLNRVAYYMGLPERSTNQHVKHRNTHADTTVLPVQQQALEA